MTMRLNSWASRWRGERRSLNLIGDSWPHDALRHGFASYFMAIEGEDATREILGHGSFDMLFKHYRSAVRRSEGDAYFSILPPESK